MTAHGTSTTTSTQTPAAGLSDWFSALMRRLFGTSIAATAAPAAASTVVEQNQDVIIAPGGYEILRPGGAAAVTNTVESLLPDVREGLSLLPPLPTVVTELLKEIQSNTSTASSVAAIAANDPSLAASLLRTVNSSATGISRKITSVAEAVSYLGFDAVRSLVVRLRLEQMLPMRTPETALEAEDLWVHSLAVSYIAGALVERVADVDRGFIATLGLLHDIGRLAMLSQFSERRKLPALPGESALQREARLFGADHAAIGAMLGNGWKFPADLTKAIRWHHDPSRAFEATDPLPLRRAVCLVQIADQLAKYCFAYAPNMEIAAPAEGGPELLGLPASMAALLDAKVRAAASQAIFFAEESSNRPFNVVRCFLKLRRGPEAVELANGLPPAGSARIATGESGVAAMAAAKRSSGFPATESFTQPKVRYTTPATADGAKWLYKTLAARWEAMGLAGKLQAPARTVLRALLPNLLESEKPGRKPIDVTDAWDGQTFALTVRSQRMAFAERMPGIDAETARQVLAAELANVLNLQWFDVECSADGQVLTFTAR